MRGNIMQLEQSFLLDEEREGFFIPSEIKQAWAAELEVFSEVDIICKKHNISYFAEWGTLLGTVRHRGFIPWDDDFDICMKRDDYNRFLQVAPEELPDGFEVYNYKNHEDFWSFMARVVGKRKICFEKNHLRKFHGFPYIAGIDIFVLDYVSADREKEKNRDAIARYVITVADAIGEGKLGQAQKKESLKKIQEICKVFIAQNLNDHELRIRLYEIAEMLFAMFTDDESAELTQMMPMGLYQQDYWLPKEYYEETVWLPFENKTMPVPCGYDAMLRKRYGDYMKVVKDGGGHDYPFFETQRKSLQAVLDFDIPAYQFKKENLYTDREETFREKIEKSLKLLRQNSMQTEMDMEKGDIEQVRQSIINCQQVAIDIGNMMEQAQRVDEKIIHELEFYCEKCFEIYEQTEYLQNGDGNGNEGKKLSCGLLKTAQIIQKSVEETVLSKKEVVFIVARLSQWKGIESVWKTASQDGACNVFVIPVPYYYKDYDGTFLSAQYEGDDFPTNVEITNYREYDFKLRCPDIIFFQNPYDEWNPVYSLDRTFYSSNLKKYTKQLVYIPPFVVEEFSKMNEKAIYNMRFYVNMPGVVLADKVIVQSENMRKLYIDVLSKFAGEDTREVWKEKIAAIGLPLQDTGHGVNFNYDELPEKWRKILCRKNGEKKVAILYRIEISSFIQYDEKMIEKIENNLQIFYEQREKVALIWCPNDLVMSVLKQRREKLYKKYCDIVDAYKEQNWGIFCNQLEVIEKILPFCEGYYGDGSSLANKFRMDGKAVMIENVNVCDNARE